MAMVVVAYSPRQALVPVKHTYNPTRLGDRTADLFVISTAGAPFAEQWQ